MATRFAASIHWCAAPATSWACVASRSTAGRPPLRYGASISIPSCFSSAMPASPKPSRPSRRQGIEWNNLWTVNPWLSFDADLSWSHARFRGSDPSGAGDYIRGGGHRQSRRHRGRARSVVRALRLRYFGPRPLVGDNAIKSASTALTNLRLGYRFDHRTSLALDVFNLFDRKAKRYRLLV